MKCALPLYAGRNQEANMAAQNSSSEKLRLIVGPYRSGKTGRLLEQMLAHCQESPFDNSLIVVPSARYRRLLEDKLAYMLRQQMTGKAQAGVLGLKIVTFHEVCNLIMQSQGRLPRLIPDKLSASIVGRVMDCLNQKQRLPVFAPIAQLTGTHATVLALIDEFERAGLSPDEISQRLEETAAAESRYRELAGIYQAYWEELDAMGYLDTKRQAFVCRESLFASECSLKFGWLVIDGFDRFSRLQAQIIKGLSLRSELTTVLFDYVPQMHLPEYAWKEDSYKELVTELAVQPELVSAPATAVAPKVESFSALDRFAEMQEIARRCKQALIMRNIPARQILVVARDLKKYRGAIEAAFDDAQLPYYVDESIELRTLPVVQFVLRLLHISIDDFKRLDVLNCLSSRYCRLESLGLNSLMVSVLDKGSWQQSLVCGAKNWQRYLQDNSIASGVQRFFELVTPKQPVATISQYCSWVEDIIDRLLNWQVDKLADAPSDNFDVRLAVIELRGVIRQLIREDLILQPGEITYESFVGRFQALVDKSNYRPAGKGSDVITICGADLAPNCKFKEIYVAGMIEGEFPRRTNSSGFVSADELARWSSYGIPLHNPRLHPGFETALFSFLKDRAENVVNLSYPRYEMGGEELIPSFFLEQEKGSAESSSFLNLHQQSIVQPLSAREAVCSWFWNYPREPIPESWLQNTDIGSMWTPLQDAIAMVKARSLAQSETVYSGYLVDLVQAGALKVPPRQSFSASRLNDYGKCPFRYWVSRVLKWSLKEEPQAGLSDKLKGETYHLCLQLFFQAIKDQNFSLPEMDEAARLKLLETCFAKAIDWLEDKAEFHPGDFWSFEKQELLFRLQRFIEQEMLRLADEGWQFVPDGFEVSFGFDLPESRPALEINVNGEIVQVAGQIDRIDVSSDRRLARVIDYKSGSSYISRNESNQGRNLQLPLYALAVQRSIIKGSEVLGGNYLSVSAAKSIGNLGKPEQVQATLAQAEEHVRSYVSAISRGDFAVRPSNKTVCKRCDQQKICRINEVEGGEIEEGSDEQAD